jgi:magnesium chelatase family protein
MNLCPCGARGDPRAACVCTPQRVERYRERLSRALLDRFDLVLVVPRPRGEELAAPSSEPSADVRLRVLLAREHLAVHDLRTGTTAAELLTSAVERRALSARARARTARVARTIAALGGAAEVEAGHLAEALSYRPPAELTG